MKERSGMPYDVVAFETDELASALSAEQEGIFHRMMRKAWINGSVPSDLEALADLCRVRPSTLRKAWPQLSKMWVPMDGNPDRLQNKKQESERIFKEKIRKQNRRAGKLSAKAKKIRKDESTRVEQVLNNRSTSLPSPSPVPILKDVSSIQDSSPPPHAAEAVRPRPLDLFTTYNENRGALPEARALTKDRLRKCSARIASTNGTFLTDFKTAIQRASVLPFCNGDGAQGWIADFDFFIANDTNYLKVLEGKYDHVRNEPGRKSKGDITREACESLLAFSDTETRGIG